MDRVSEAHGLFVASGEYHVTHDHHVTVHDDVVMLTIQLTPGPPGSSSSWTPA